MFFQVLIICANIVGLDGCFIKLTTGQQILAAIGRDGNNNIFPIAFGIFLTMKTAGLAPHNILLIKQRQTGFPQDEERNKRIKEKREGSKEGYTEKGCTIPINYKETKKQRRNSPQGGRKSIHLRRASLNFRLIR